MEKPKVGILTTFSNFDPAYSLVAVVQDQLAAHIRAGYRPVLFVLENFTDHKKIPKGVEVRPVLPKLMLEPYAGNKFPAHWQDDAKKVTQALVEQAKDIDVLLTHDIIFIDTYLPYNIGLREARLGCKQFHWVHSAPSPRPVLENNPHANRYALPPNSKLVYLNHDKQVALAEMYGVFPEQVRVIHNSRDPRLFWDLDNVTSTIIDKTNLLQSDVISVYPVSTPRMVDGKQIDVVIKIHEALRKLGLKTTLIVPNAHANGANEIREVSYRHNQNVFFTSMLGKDFEQGVPSSVVSNLFRLANVFVFPSVSENCSLVLLEAMMAGNLLVLNKDCSGLSEFAGNNALYFKFGSLDMGQRTYESALLYPQYYSDIAKIIKSEFARNRPLQAKRHALQTHNFDAVFEQIENLYYEQ